MVKRELKLCIENALYSSTVRENYETNLLESKKCLEALYDGTGKGSNFTGWVNLPSSITEELLSDIEATAKRLREECTYVVMIGIGGSYLGTKAVVEALSDSFALLKPTCGARLLYAGHHISEDYLSELIELLKGEKFGIINISKSGTTTEPAIAFRLLKSLLEEQEGLSFAQKHIIAITDERKGALRQLANNQGYKTYVIPDNVGGRFSVLTPVGLLPISVAGFDIRRLVAGAKNMEEELASTSISEIKNNTAAQYAAIRLALYNEGKKIEILGNYHPKLQYFNEWWKQLYGESEGKDGKGIFPASVTFTTDLHSMGQWIQDGVRNIFETIISVKNPNRQLEIPHDEVNLDGLNFISGRTIDYVNKMAEQGTQLAHIDGGVPNIKIEIEQLDAYAVGQLFYFFELAVGISGYLLDVNPFDQPGVEAYKNNMFALLEKPGFEKETNKLKERLKRL